jgi:RNA-directed DNA polymerase
VGTDLARIGEKARREPKLVFTTLYHHIADVDNLRDCYNALDGTKATGVDRETKAQYGKNLEENLQELSARLKRMGYRPQCRRRAYIPKPGSPKGRPLGISTFEDKIVELSTKRVLEMIYEEQFEDSSYGYRPGRNQHVCLDALGRTIQQRRTGYVVEADIRSFFDRVDHDWMLKFLQHRVGDPRVIRLVTRMLKAGIMEDGLVRVSVEGTPQGSILSPLLSNTYLHYVLDAWFRLKVKPQCSGEASYFRYADDFIAVFQYKDDAMNFIEILRERLAQFSLTLSEDKTRLLPFGRFAQRDARSRGRKAGTFTFLGFTHYCSETRNGYFKLKRRTSVKKYSQSLRRLNKWANCTRSKLRTGVFLRCARNRVEGHLNYYAVSDNLERCTEYVRDAMNILYKWVNRKGQRRTYTWEGFQQALKWIRWPRVSIRVNLSPCRRLAVT